LKKKNYLTRNDGEISAIIFTRSADVRAFRRLLLEWYGKYGRHFPWRNKSANSYQRIVAEVLLQRTRAENVASFYGKFVRKYPSWKKLALATEKELGLFLKPLGLWKRRASSLLRLASELTKRNGRFPRTREEIESLPNVGQYIANAVHLFCLGDPQPLLDSNMARVLERYFGPRNLADIRYDPYLQALAKSCVTCKDSILLNWSILDLGALICTLRNPRHASCPLSRRCKYAIEDYWPTCP